MTTRVIVFPFDLFGGSGCGAGAELLADELRTVLADNRRETVPTRAMAYTPHVRLKQVVFEDLKDVQGWREEGQRLVRQTLEKNQFLLWLGGNHLSCLPVYDVLARRDTPPLVIQLDAHLDIHKFEGYSRSPSHGNFLLHCEGPLPPMINLGHRELLLTRDEIFRHFRAVYPSSEMSEGVPEFVREEIFAAENIFIDLDCDVFDAAYFPAVTRPVPFGLSPLQVLALLEAVWSDKVRGLMISEFDPARDQNDRSLALLIWLIEHLLIKCYEPKEP